MTGEHESDRCYFCGGRLAPGVATLPFVLDARVVIIKDVPANVCVQCGEAILDSETARIIDRWLKQVEHLGFDVSVITYAHVSGEAVAVG